MKKLITLLLVLCGGISQASAEMYILGTNAELGNWDPNNPKVMTQSADGTYYYSFTASASTTYYFCFSSAKSTDWSVFNASSIRPKDGSSYRLSFGQPYTEAISSGKNDGSFYLDLVEGTDYLIGFDQSSPRVVVTYTPSNLYVLGGANGWAANSGVSMTLTEDYIYTCDFEISSSITTFSFATQLGANAEDWSGFVDYRFGAGSSDGNYLINTFPNTNIGLGWGSDNNHSFNIPTEGFYKLILDYKLLKLAVYQTERVTTNASGYCTYVNTNPLTIPAFTAYYAKDNGNGSATAYAITNPPANTPMLIKGDPSTTYYFAVASSGTALENTNAFQAGDGNAVAKSDDGKYNYLLNGATFKAANGTNKVAVGKAYLQLSQEATGASRILIFDEDSETTGIRLVDYEQQTSDDCYNLQGIKVASPTKGVYLRNGKKFIVK